MSENGFKSLDVSNARNELIKLYEQVARSQGRVELTKEGSSEDGCVIISKRELDGLERALQILSDAPSVQSLADSIEHLCEVCSTDQIPAS
jgi:hypothetical protein